MKCRHCCFACTSRGKDISREDFFRAVALAKEFEQHITIGGGEPTLHPLFREFVMHAVWELADVTDSSGFPAVGMVTNGSNTELALHIAKLAELGVISASVSHDEYHDPIDERVYRAFEKPKPQYGHVDHTKENDHRGVNGGGNYIIPVGRAKSWGNNPFIKCVCDSVFVFPNGKVYPCGCKKTCLGHVSGNVALKYEHFDGYCEKGEGYVEHVINGENS